MKSSSHTSCSTEKTLDTQNSNTSPFGEENTESLHIANKGAHGSAWENTRPAFLEEYGFDPDFFQHYKTQRKQAEKEFLDWKQKRKKINEIDNSHPKQDNIDLWRRFDLTDDE